MTELSGLGFFPARSRYGLFPQRGAAPLRPRCRRAAPPARALFGDLLQRLPGSPGAWWQPPDPARLGRKAEQVEEEVQAIRRLLEGCRRERELHVPSLDDALLPAHSAPQSLDQQEALVAAALHADPSCAASNAVPFSAGAISAPEGARPEGGAGSGPFGGGGSPALGAAPRVEAVRPILPCIFAAEGKLDMRAAEFLASQLALSQLQLLDFSRFRDGQARCLPDNVFWCGPEPFPSCRVAAAATLHRMVARRGGLGEGLPQVSGHAIVLGYHPQDRQLVAETVALYLHLYCGFELEQAAKEARQSMGAAVSRSVLLPCLEELAAAAAGWQRRVKLVWPYSGGRVELSGEAVGGWERKLPMAFDVQRRQWELWFWGLPPGIYRCKFIVDGRWCIDMAAPTEYDSRGNANNVFTVPEEPPPAAPPPALGASSRDSLGGSLSGGESGSDEEEARGGGRGEGPRRAAPVAAAAAAREAGSPSAAVAASGDGGGEPGSLYGGAATEPAGGEAAPGVLGVGPDPLQAPLPAAEEGPRPEAGWGAQLVGAPGGDMVRFGAALLAFYTKLATQRRVPGGHH